LRERVASVFRSRPMAYWTAAFSDIDGCGAPVLDLEELADDPHLSARGTVVRDGAGVAAAPAPRLSASPGRLRPKPSGRGAHTREVLREAGLGDDEISRLEANGTVAGR
ncbi:MAG: alpha-methylacyl-CoA racemase, partial [Pseudonocardiales bacterium]|nr:alpha-methylacyl-CoA racemase [Pseudonocardiales bacterium]